MAKFGMQVGNKPLIKRFYQLSVEQPFVNMEGSLCIKGSDDFYIKLSDSKGNTQTEYYTEVDSDMAIRRALPMVERWNF